MSCIRSRKNREEGTLRQQKGVKDRLDICLLIVGIVVQFQIEVDGNPSSTCPVKINFSATEGEKIGMEEK